MGPAEPETCAGQVIAGRYSLASELAMGGMGTVWVAHDQKLDRNVALKVMRRKSLEAFPDARERFEREARAAAALKSAHVVAVHDYGVDEDLPFIAMELLDGESLKERLARAGAFSLQGTAELLRQVAKGLKAAHRAGLVHRDLKPSNIFLAQHDDEEVIKLLDFGVVKNAGRRSSDETASGVLLGTPQYMSPEQARGNKTIDHRADLWSLAVILYEMLTGENPFDSEAEAVGDIVIRVCVEPITPPSVIKPELPSSMDSFFEIALARDPENRFQSVEELAESFMLAADLSFAGLDERSAETSGRGRMSRPTLQRTDPAPTSDPPLEIEDSSSAAMATSLDDVRPRGSRRAAILFAVAAIGIGFGFGVHSLFRSDRVPSAATSAAPASQPVGGLEAPPPPVIAPARAPVAPEIRDEPPSEPKASEPRASPPLRPVPRLPPSSTASDPGEGGGPPTWYKAAEPSKPR